MKKEMNALKSFDVYDEVKIEDCTPEQTDEALDCRWVKVRKDENELSSARVFQNVEQE